MRWLAVLGASLVLGMIAGASLFGVATLRDDAHSSDTAIPSASEAAILGAHVERPTLFRFAQNPRILVLIIPTMRTQADMLNRVAALVEVRGFDRDRITDPTVFAQTIRARGAEPDTFYFGHDYRTADLQRFFSLADRDNMPLTIGEAALQKMLGTVLPHGRAPQEALITLPAPGAGPDEAARAAILRHELSHGEYFTNVAYADYVRTFWRTGMTDVDRAAFTRFLARQDYDTANADLVMNETQAYLMHTADARFFSPSAVGLAPEQIAALRSFFARDMPDCWLRHVAERTTP